MHLIYSPDLIHRLNASGKINADWDFFLFLKEMGRATADAWQAGIRSASPPASISAKIPVRPGQPEWSDLSEVCLPAKT